MRVILFALLFLVASVSGDCTGCWAGTSGVCKGADTVCYGYQTGTSCYPGTTECTGGGTNPTDPATNPPATDPPATQPPATQPPQSGCGNCITKQMLININSQSSWWGRCDWSQPAKPSSQGDGFYCTDDFVAKLNEMLCSLNYCHNLQAKRAFIAQVTHETAYFTKFYQPLDEGRGALHMLPGNMNTNIQDIQDQWPGSNAVATFNSQGAAMLTTPEYAWLSAAAWFLRTNRVIPNCGKNLFLESFSETSRCVFGNGPDGGLAERQNAFNYAQTYITGTSASENSSISSAPSFSLLVALGFILLLLKRI